MRRSQRRGDPVTAAGMNGDLAPMRDRGEIERWSTRSFGEYAFLEDSRYASQGKNSGDAKTVRPRVRVAADLSRYLDRATSTFS
jgi:hypothetical protein